MGSIDWDLLQLRLVILKLPSTGNGSETERMGHANSLNDQVKGRIMAYNQVGSLSGAFIPLSLKTRHGAALKWF